MTNIGTQVTFYPLQAGRSHRRPILGIRAGCCLQYHPQTEGKTGSLQATARGTAILRSNHGLHGPGEAPGGHHPMPPRGIPRGKGT